MNVEKAIAFMERNGTPIEKYRLHFLLGKEIDDNVPLRYLADLQNEDGGFPYDNEKGKISCVSSTYANLDVMVELNLMNSQVFRRAADYLAKIQKEDGSWSENDEIRQYDPPFWDLPRDLKTSMWLTADIANYFIRSGCRESQPVQRAAAFLRGNRDEEGKFAGFLHSTWISIAVFGQLEGSESEIVKKALNVIDRNLDRLDEGTVLAWCLDCLHAAGLTKGSAVVRRCIDSLVSLQQENGAWVSSEGEERATPTTISVLKTLKKYEIW
jgi:hypothetical protein